MPKALREACATAPSAAAAAEAAARAGKAAGMSAADTAQAARPGRCSGGRRGQEVCLRRRGEGRQLTCRGSCSRRGSREDRQGVSGGLRCLDDGAQVAEAVTHPETGALHPGPLQRAGEDCWQACGKQRGPPGLEI